MNVTALHEHLQGRRNRLRGQPSKHRPVLTPLRQKARRTLASMRSNAHVWPVSALARLTGAKTVIVNVPRFAGVFELDIRSHIFRSVVADTFERDLATLVSELVGPEDDVVDVGANAGLFTVLAASRAKKGRVLAIEASPGVGALLRGNLTRNGTSSVELFAGAAASHDQGVTLHVPQGNDEYASMGGLNHPNAPTDNCVELTVPSDSLDHLIESRELKPSLVKIDVEGAEGEVLRGASTLLQKHRPVLLSELDDRLLSALGDNARTVVELLAEADYRVYDAYSAEELKVESLPAQFVGEILAIPRELAQ